MTNKLGLTQALQGLCGLFGVVIGGEWAYIDRGIDQSRLEMDRPVKSNVTLDRVDHRQLLIPPKEKFSAIVKRPLMIMGRKPVADEGSFLLAQARQRGNFPIRAMGIAMTPDTLSALVKDSKGSYHRLQINESINGWTLDEVRPDWIIMKRGEVRQQLKLHEPQPTNPGGKVRRGESRSGTRPKQVRNLESNEQGRSTTQIEKDKAPEKPSPPELDDLAW